MMDPMDAPEYLELSQRTSIARKQYMCDACSKPIEIGTKYIRIAHLIDYKFEVYRVHYTCPGVEMY